MEDILIPDRAWFFCGTGVSLWMGILFGSMVGFIASFSLPEQKWRPWYLRGILLCIFLLSSGALARKYSGWSVESTLMELLSTDVKWQEFCAGGLGLGAGLLAGTALWIPILGLAGNPGWLIKDPGWSFFLLFCVLLSLIVWVQCGFPW